MYVYDDKLIETLCDVKRAAVSTHVPGWGRVPKMLNEDQDIKENLRLAHQDNALMSPYEMEVMAG